MVIILDSLIILALMAAALIQPRFQNLLPLAGLLAGLNAALHSRTLDGLEPSLRRTLLIGGLVTVAVMTAVTLVPRG